MLHFKNLNQGADADEDAENSDRNSNAYFQINEIIIESNDHIT